MTGLLAANGIRVCQTRVGESLKRVDARHHSRRQYQLHRRTNPIPYCSRYFGEKVHIDQNEKLVLFGVTHVCAVDGYSGKIVGYALMAIKNCVTVYEQIFRYIVIIFYVIHVHFILLLY